MTNISTGKKINNNKNNSISSNTTFDLITKKRLNHYRNKSIRFSSLILIKLCLTIVFHSHNKSMNKEILIDKKEEKKRKRVAINQLRNAEDNAGAKREKKRRKKKAPREEDRIIRKILHT